ncbi:hypothetical protein [Pseudoalteromonas maricaloris]|uniref:Uncharacterized protein n=1 Tax=Pseudoalteromonas maricaloris TaxID=184924 RepID=A0A8I2H4S7_9GAMM|nr:hypothetical protein [Pseudoalteromonas maricaloris]NLR23533.1 hypothetical protein [Pseudoalteromonas maricaloris]WOX29342.1 hypothetical protein R5H13_03465 [Pseudoalteromonas maricaloris]
MLSLLTLDEIVVTAVPGYGLHDISKYTKGQQVVYIKHVFVSKIHSVVKPNITAEEIDFLRRLDQMHQYCYFLVYVKNKGTGKYDHAFFMDDAEAIKGLEVQEVTPRLKRLDIISQVIRSVLV